MRSGILLLNIFIFLISAGLEAYSAPVKASKGVIDLRGTVNPDHYSVNLNGEWAFYWKKMLRPHDFSSRKFKPDYYGKVPSYWTEYPEDLVKTEKKGYATYKLTVLLPPGAKKVMAFDMPVFDSSYDIYINGSYFGGNGIPGKTAVETVPGYKRNFFRYEPRKDTLDIIINVSNFNHRRGGFWLPVRMGTFSEIQKQLAAKWAGDWSVVSILVGFSVFFLLFFLFSPGEKILGFFSLAAAALALRPLFTSNFLILNFFDLKWDWIVRFEYIDLYLIIVSWTWVVQLLYPARLFRFFAISVTVLFGALSVFSFFFPPSIFTWSIEACYPAIVILMSYATIRSFLGIRRNTTADTAYFIAFIFLLTGGIHDVKVSLGMEASSTGYILTYFVVVFVFIQAVLLLYKWIMAFKEKEKLQEKMEYMNMNLEKLINERTHEIQLRTEEIENQSKRIELQNKQLSDTIQVKNRIFSVIAHDLRGPVVNILYMLNLLKEKEYKEKYDTFANSSIQYAQLVISLLENMLVWGRGQEDRIKFSPGKYDLTEIILTNLSIFKESADMKEIDVNFTQVGSSIGYFDKDLFDIIIRNLLSNALKYTPRGGRVSILLKNKAKSGEGILLKVCDNGTGIPESKQKNLFSSAEIESTPGTESEKGTGLGLKLCQELIKINNGSISVESKEGEGTCFLISLPVE